MIDEGDVICQILGLRFTLPELYAAKDILDSPGYNVLSRLLERRKALDIDELIGNPDMSDLQIRETRGSLRMLREVEGFADLITAGIAECEAQS